MFRSPRLLLSPSLPPTHFPSPPSSAPLRLLVRLIMYLATGYVLGMRGWVEGLIDGWVAYRVAVVLSVYLPCLCRNGRGAGGGREALRSLVFG